MSVLWAGILADGCFDPLHAGHIAYLDAARRLETSRPLIVNVAPDAVIRAKGRPVLQPHADRCTTIAALKGVHDVVALPTVAALELIRPAVYVKGIDWQGRLPADQVAVCQAQGTAIKYTPTCLRRSADLWQRWRYGTSLEEFATRVLTQPPAARWVPVTPYGLESRRLVEARHPHLILDTFQPSAVLDVGCGPGVLLRLMAELATSPWIGVGVDLLPPVNGAVASPLTFCQGSILDDRLADHLPPGRQYDLVICREVLEHLTIRDVACAVRNLCRLSTRFIYVTARFHPCPAGLLDVATTDDLDPTHISLLNQDFLRVLFTLQGTRRRADLETRLDWQQKGRVVVYEHPPRLPDVP